MRIEERDIDCDLCGARYTETRDRRWTRDVEIEHRDEVITVCAGASCVSARVSAQRETKYHEALINMRAARGDVYTNREMLDWRAARRHAADHANIAAAHGDESALRQWVRNERECDEILARLRAAREQWVWEQLTAPVQIPDQPPFAARRVCENRIVWGDDSSQTLSDALRRSQSDES